MEDLSVDILRIRNKKEYEEAKQELLEELEKVTIPKIKRSRMYNGHLIAQRDRIIGTIGRTENFGFGRTRRKGYTTLAANKKNPELFRALVRFGNATVPKGWAYQTITLNDGVKAKKHIDGQNVGKSVIVGIGDYEGGNVRVYDEDGKDFESIDVQNSPLMFNGALLPHETEPFKGQRYTIIFFRQKAEGTVPGVTMEGSGVFA